MTYFVKYSKNGKVYADRFETLEQAQKDYAEKKRIDKEGLFDDRFVIGITDDGSNTICDESKKDG